MPAKIITVFNEKGGSSKTTLSCQLANALGLRGHSVMVADLDTQQASTRWSAAGAERGAFKAVVWSGAAYGANVSKEVAKVYDHYDFIIADCAPSVDQPTTWSMLLVSDLGLIPTRLGPIDMLALGEAKQLAARALKAAGRAFPVRVVVSGAKMHMADDKRMVESLQADADFPALKEILGDRKAYQRSLFYGSSVHNTPNARDAIHELEALTDSVLALVGMPKLKKVANQ